MLVMQVHISVKPESVEEFKAATIENASHSLEEPGIARFDILQQEENPLRFLLIEAYRTPEDVQRHKETAHYLRWRNIVAPMMAEPRAGVKYRHLYPPQRQ